MELTGEQAQAVTLLTQWLPAEKGQSYRIEYAYEAQGDNSAVLGQTSGLAWVISDPVSGSVIAQSEDLKGAQGSLSGLLDFTADAAVGGTAAARLSLRYARTPGTFRHEEKFTIRKVSSRLLPAQGKP